MCKKPFWAKKNTDKWLQLEFNIEFLKKTKLKHGGLHCEYCGKENLIVYEWCEKINHENVATVDHFYPKSKFEDLKMDENNFVVSCYNCNSKKRDMILSVDEIKFPLNEEKLNNLNYIK
jgi:5-methylcytosine-specific restriction endonuclease McrA